ncbi:MAG: DNA polymerase III subunit alpha, partial [Alphaproteobacteria bacterium]|nr:DNA polymerase III subunit alpha [Alphaproteobacteria bacterium]
AKLIPNNPANPVTLQEALDGDPDLRLEIKKDESSERLIHIALQLEGLYRHASTHAAGVVIGDRPLHELVPLYRDPRSDMPVTQFNMKYVEQAGLVKFDFLGLKTMTVIHKAVKMIKKNKDIDINILEIPFDDPKTFEMLKAGHNIGVFQVESAGMRDLGKQIGLSNLEELLAVIALFRPGPMENIPTYLSNVKKPEDIDYMHDKLKPITEDTYGVMIYQEQVMQAAQVLAGYTLGGADLLRRAMGKKIKEEMDKQREMFVQGANDNNQIPEKQANHIFDQIAAFAGYGFNKAHTAGYGLVSYWTAWLKANHPLEFMAASMTLDLGNTDKLSVFKQELDRMGLELRGPDVNFSFADFQVEEDSVRYALGALKGVGSAAMKSLVEEREANGKYASVDDYASRLDYKSMNKRQLEGMIAAGAFDTLNNNRAQLSAGAEIMLRHAQNLAEEKESGQSSLFGGGDEGGEGLGMPELPNVQPWDPLERLEREFKAVGFYLSAHPLDSRQQQFENLKIASLASVEEALQNVAASRFQMAGVLLKKQEKVSQKGSKYAFLQLSDPTGIYEVTLFSELLATSREYLEAGNSLLLGVEAEQREDQIRFTCTRIEPLDGALENKIRSIDIHMDSRVAGAEPINEIKKFLDIEGQGSMVINLHVRIDDDRVVTMTLPKRWSLSSQARNIIRTQDGISDILEA